IHQYPMFRAIITSTSAVVWLSVSVVQIFFQFPSGKIVFVIHQRRSCLCSSKKEQKPICTNRSEMRELSERNITDNSAHNKFKNTTGERRTKTYENSITNR